MKKLITFVVLITATLVAAPNVLAADVASSTEVQNVTNFISSSVTVLIAIAGALSGAFFSWGGYGYITSMGNPESLERSKKTIMYSAVGLSITTGAFILTKIVENLAKNAFSSN